MAKKKTKKTSKKVECADDHNIELCAQTLDEAERMLIRLRKAAKKRRNYTVCLSLLGTCKRYLEQEM